jgi:Ketopantoate reductase PanE/ApbA
VDVLVVGAGAVGQVLGLHLSRGGARVAFLVKPAHEAEARRGFRLRELRGARTIQSFSAAEILTSPREAAAKRWDLIVLAVSSTALRSGPWLDELAASEGARFVAIQPGLEDPAYVAARVGQERLMWGMFPLVAFADGDVLSYFRPPLGRLPFSGPGAAEVAAAFRKGGLPARVHSDVPTALAFSGALLELLIIALECAGWRFSTVGPELPSALGGLREVLAISARHRQARAPFAMSLLRPWMIRLALPIVRRLAPFAVEDYLRAHFTKVGDQTLAQLDTWMRRAAEYQLPAPTLEALRGRLAEVRKAA